MPEIRVAPWYIFKNGEMNGLDETKWRIYADDKIVGIVFETGNISITESMPQQDKDLIFEKVRELFQEENPEAEFEVHAVPEEVKEAKSIKSAKPAKKRKEAE